MTASLDRLRIDCDDDGFHLVVTTDEDESGNARVGDVDAARADLRAALAVLDDYAAERDRERAAYDRATPEERDAVLGRSVPRDDPWEAARVKADIDRKIDRGE
jgi:hypothetical protein